MSEQANPQLQKAEDQFKSLVWDPIVSTELEALFVKAPWMRVWPVKQIVTGVANLIADRMYGTLKLVIDLGAIVYVNAAHKAAFDKASVTLKIIGQEKGFDSDEYRKAKENAKVALSQFVRFGASA